MVIDNKFTHGDVVFLITDPEQQPAIVVSIEIYKIGEIMYKINRGTVSSYHYEFELSTEKNILIGN